MQPAGGWMALFMAANKALDLHPHPAESQGAVRAACAAVHGTSKASHGLRLLCRQFQCAVGWEDADSARRTLVRWRRFAAEHPDLECCALRLRLSAASLDVIRMHGKCAGAAETARSLEHLVRGVCKSGEVAPERRGELLVSVAHLLLGAPAECPVKTHALCADVAASLVVGERDTVTLARALALHAHAAARLGLDVEARGRAALALAVWPEQLRHTVSLEKLLHLIRRLGSPCPVTVLRAHVDLVSRRAVAARLDDFLSTSGILAVVALSDACDACGCALQAATLLRPLVSSCSTPALRELVTRRLATLMVRGI